MTIEELYTKKGEAITQIEVWQAKLQEINQQIVGLLNAKSIEEPPSKS